jgi:hypothetical protein
MATDPDDNGPPSRIDDLPAFPGSVYEVYERPTVQETQAAMIATWREFQLLLLLVAAVPCGLSFYFWRSEDRQPEIWEFLLVAASGAFGMAAHAWLIMRRPTLGILPGIVAGVGIYLVTSLHFAGRQLTAFIEVILPVFIGGCPGLLWYILALRRRNRKADQQVEQALEQWKR